MSTTRTYSHAVAEEVRAMMGRRRVTGKQVAAAIGVSQPQASARINGAVAWSVDDVYAVAALLDCKVADLLPDATRQYGLAA